MTPDQAHLGFAAFDGMSLAEDVQLVLAVGNGQLRQGAMETAAAALVELALRGRVGSEPDAGFFAGPIARKLIVIDASPTGERRFRAATRGSSAPWSTLCWASGGCMTRQGPGLPADGGLSGCHRRQPGRVVCRHRR